MLWINEAPTSMQAFIFLPVVGRRGIAREATRLSKGSSGGREPAGFEKAVSCREAKKR
jgi:hypothetical protein